MRREWHLQLVEVLGEAHEQELLSRMCFQVLFDSIRFLVLEVAEWAVEQVGRWVSDAPVLGRS